jgi:hypothetical protein
VQAGVITQVHTSYYLGAKNPDVRDALAGFLIGAGENAYFSGPYTWAIAQTWSDPEVGCNELIQFYCWNLYRLVISIH